MTWAGERSEQPRSFQSPEMFFLLTLPFIERACIDWSGQLLGGRLSGSLKKDAIANGTVGLAGILLKVRCKCELEICDAPILSEIIRGFLPRPGPAEALREIAPRQSDRARAAS
jgi:hypothetical protein